MQEILDFFQHPQAEEILALAPVAVVVIEMPSMRYVLANSMYCDVLRTPLKPRELVGMPCTEVLASPNPEAVAALVRAHERGEATRFGTIESNSVGLEKSYWTGASIPIGKRDGGTLVLGLLTEITSQVRARQDAQGKQRELEREQQRTAEFMAMAVHELRTPLTGLKMLTQLLLQTGNAPRSAAVLQKIDQQSTRLVRLINDLLNSVKAATGQLDLHVEGIGVAQLLQEVAEDTASLSGAERVEWIPPAVPGLSVRADRERLRQVLVNLVHNALIHSGSEAPVQVDAIDEGTRLRLRVSDRGAGIPTEDLERIFDRFCRGSSGKRSAGLGLGLYLSRLFVGAMGGRIWAESKGPGLGARFTIELERIVP